VRGLSASAPHCSSYEKDDRPHREEGGPEDGVKLVRNRRLSTRAGGGLASREQNGGVATPARVLVVDDDRALRDAITRALSLEGYSVVTAADGVEALSATEQHRPEAIVLDLGLPTLDGITVCQVLRARADRTPILVLTARSEVSDRVQGLDAGADDFMSKPFALEELLARLRALLRRAAPGDAPVTETHDDSMWVSDLRVSPSQRRAWRGDREIDLTKTEFDLLELLVRNAGIVLDRTTIHDRIWGYDFGPDSKNLTVYMGYLRAKTESDGEPRLLHTVRGVGYVARED
jgi:two-component system response regulator MprA